MTMDTVIRFRAVNTLLVDDDSRTPQATSTKNKIRDLILLDAFYFYRRPS